jgi:predicted O-linked N-acetylglucosamine transferase (SPINDLY family)
MLYADSEFAASNLRREAEQRGIQPERLVFGKRVAVPDYLARYAACDLFLDTLPYNAGTTANDVLWMGLPLLTCMGETMTGRMAASLLHTLGLNELIASDWIGYEAKAIELATKPERYAAIKARLQTQRSASPLFDTPRTTRAIEAGCKQALQRYWTGLPPEHIWVRD